MVQVQRAIPVPGLHYLSPLDRFFDEANRPMPASRLLEADEMPLPYRRLLCHHRDMTPTLEAAWGDSIHLRVLDSQLHDDVVRRQVVLTLDGDETPVEMGAIEIRLTPFPERARELIRAQSMPLGTILQTEEITHSSSPSAYFEITPDEGIRDALQTDLADTLYGRQNLLRHESGAILAQVLEILPPTDPFNR